MEKLKDIEQLSATELGVKSSIATLVRRDGDIAWYKRGHNIHEVFIVKVQKPYTAKIAGREVTFAHKELYPTSNDFGMLAWCYNDEKIAEREFKSLVEVRHLLSHEGGTPDEALVALPQLSPNTP